VGPDDPGSDEVQGMNPLMTNLFADDRYRERLLAACRMSAWARLVRSWRSADAVEPAGLPVSATASVVAQPHWWADAFEAARSVGVRDTAGCD
jgi:hypothetical protein